MTSAPSLRPVANTARHFDPVLRPDLAPLYHARAERLAALAEGHDLAAYLHLAAQLCMAQAECATQTRLPMPQVDPAAIAAQGRWLDHLDHLLSVTVAGPAAQHLDVLRALPRAERINAGRALADGRFDDVDPALAPILWAALSVEVALIARSSPLPAAADHETPTCPICGCLPVASLVLGSGTQQGLRYLHCALCECEWHVVRAKCTNCGGAAHLDYLSFDTAEAAVRAEACGDCGSYLKVISQERETRAEVVADDLATLSLDDASVGEGYGRSGFNPWALPG